ncbi:hypothetical protein NQ314_015657 [Rhamnusium bicolor]|uniref:Uncharacterized protein n=1 Tax=Rhamnusium bicolor TaxID=1586634 RepID=A0AAV8WYV8_9CUCU|nr:hypothetical protein NQ314_015657 [Rhamnusium bicolor]
MQWSQNLCRTCGQISDTCHFIYNKDIPSSLENKIKKYLHLNLYKGDYKPKQICNSCIIKLNEFADFIDTCHTTNQKFEMIYFNSQTWHNRNYEYPPPQKQSVIVSSKQVADNLDFELYKNTGIVLENLNVTNCQLNDAEMLDLVGNGDYNSGNSENYMNDMKLKGHHTTVLRHPTNLEGSVLPANYNCQSLEKNDKMCYSIRYDSYNPDSISSVNISKEINAQTEKKRTVTIDSVKKSLTLPGNKMCSPKETKKTYFCPHCDREFIRKGTLNSHIAVHTNIRPYKCGECSKSFAVKSDLTTHKKVHSDQHKCSFCFKKFSVPSKLERHIRIHTNEKPYICNFVNCNKAFSDKRNLEEHKLTHVSEKKYSCTVCNKMFKTLNRLKQHSKCHSCGIMYTCDLCSKTYKYKSNLISHIKKHNSICLYCKKNCESNTLLTEHIKTCRVRN